MDLFESLQCKAMQAAIDPDDSDYLHRIFRWYSKTYATPLHTIGDLPLEDVLYCWYAENYENMSDEDREEKIEWLLMSPEDRAKQDRGEIVDAKEEEFFNKLNSEVASGEVSMPKERKHVPVAAEVPTTTAAQKMAALVQKAKNKATKTEGASLPEIKMDFGGDNLQGNPWADLDPLAPKKK